jgi:hypothetical protein
MNRDHLLPSPWNMWRAIRDEIRERVAKLIAEYDWASKPMGRG